MARLRWVTKPVSRPHLEISTHCLQHPQGCLKAHSCPLSSLTLRPQALRHAGEFCRLYLRQAGNLSTLTEGGTEFVRVKDWHGDIRYTRDAASCLDLAAEHKINILQFDNYCLARWNGTEEGDPGFIVNYKNHATNLIALQYAIIMAVTCKLEEQN